ncbi:MAG: ABC transporter permease [Bryobacterales bacterium]|nr:ABC transporter permease [Bryobacterales bacterium]
MRLFDRFGRKRREQDLDAEVRSYIDSLVEEKIRGGMFPDEAKRQARMEAGGIEQVKEEVRQARTGAWFDVLLQDIRYGARLQRCSPGYTAAIVLTFALGIGANTALFSVVNGLLLHRLPYRDPDRLFYVSEFWPHQPLNPGPPSPDFVHWKKEARLLEGLEGYLRVNPTLTRAGDPERLEGAMVTRGLLDLLGVQPALGRTFTAEEDRWGGPPAVILSDAVWRRKFGASSNVVGKTAELNGRSSTIVGVLPASFVFPDDTVRAEIIEPMALPASAGWSDQPIFAMYVLARLKPRVTAAAARQELFAITRGHAAEETPVFAALRKDMKVTLASLRQRLSGDVRPVILILQTAVGLVLLIGCFNVANLQLARSISRWREIAVRTALGAERSRLVRQLLTESLVLSCFGGGAGLLVGLGCLRYLKLALPANLQLLPNVRVDYAVLTATSALTILVGILTALAPAMAATRADLTVALKESSDRATGSRGQHRMRGAFVIGEIAMAIVLLTGSGLLIRSFVRLTSSELGFQPGGVLTMRISLPFRKYVTQELQIKFLSQLVERAQGMRGVYVAAIGDGLPLGISRTLSGVTLEGQTPLLPGREPIIAVTSVSPEYFRALRIPLVQGRPFSETDREDSPSVILVNQAFASRFFGSRNAIGKRVNVGLISLGRSGPWQQIVGVVGNVRQQRLRVADEPRIYVSYRQFGDPVEMLILKSSTPRALAPAATKIVHAIDPTVPVDDVTTMDQRVAESLSSDRTNTLLIGIFAALGLVQAVVGIFSVIAYLVSQRSHEIAIRMALGAQPREAFLLVLRHGMILTATGIAIGLAGAIVATRPLRSLLYGVAPGDPLTIVAVVALLAMVAMTTCYLPARRAAELEPAVVLRHQ